MNNVKKTMKIKFNLIQINRLKFFAQPSFFVNVNA